MSNKQEQQLTNQSLNSQPIQWKNATQASQGTITTSTNTGGLILGSGLSGSLNGGLSTSPGSITYSNPWYYNPYNNIIQISPALHIEKALNGYIIRKADGTVYVCEKKRRFS